MEPIYRYFVQPQLNLLNNTVYGYELLIKQTNPRRLASAWILCRN